MPVEITVLINVGTLLSDFISKKGTPYEVGSGLVRIQKPHQFR
jgi:hypothetical protein